MMCRLLALSAAAVTLASAQLPNVFGEGHRTYKIDGNDCMRIRLGGADADRASFAVTSFALGVSGMVRPSSRMRSNTQHGMKHLLIVVVA